MKSFTITALLFVLIAFFASPIVADYVERRGYDQGFGALEARAPVPEPARRRGGSGGDDDDEASATETGAAATSTSIAGANMANLAGVGVMAAVVGGVLY